MLGSKFFQLDQGQATDPASRAVALEQDLQELIEANTKGLFGVRFLACEYSTGMAQVAEDAPIAIG